MFQTFFEKIITSTKKAVSRIFSPIGLRSFFYKEFLKGFVEKILNSKLFFGPRSNVRSAQGKFEFKQRLIGKNL